MIGIDEIYVKSVVGFEGLYEVSSDGRVFSLNYDGTNKRKEISCGRNKDGYRQCVLYKNGKKFCRKLHRLIAETFIPNPNNYPQVNHKDEDKNNNSVENLEWCTVKYNANYGSRNSKIKEAVMKRDKRKVGSIDSNGNIVIYDSMELAEKLTNANQSNISACCRGVRKFAGGFMWRYV